MTIDRKTHIRVADRFPEFFREDYPLFVSFVEEYYKFLDSRYASNLETVSDIDLCADIFLPHFRNTFCPTLPEFEHADLRLFIQHAGEFYSLKGTIDSVKFLFKILFNEIVDVFYPGETLLRASDGKWNQEYFITLDRSLGEVPVESGFNLVFSNGSGTFLFDIIRTEQITNLSTRFYFQPGARYNLDANQVFYIYDLNDINLYVGVLRTSPSKILISDPGKYWVVGKVFKIPGDVKDTICQVTRIDDNGGIAAAEILEYGYLHVENQISTISPYKNKPSGSSLEYTRTLVSFSPQVYEHSLQLNDYTDGATEQLYGIGTTNTYLIDPDYVETGYFGLVVFAQESIAQVNSVDESLIDITIEQWLESRATVILTYADVIKTKGYWGDESGLILNNSIRLQDNDVHQVFSYSVDTTRDISEYQSIISNVHPAGFRYYANLSKTFVYKSDYSASRSISHDTLFLSDALTEIADSVEKYVSKDLFHAVAYEDTKPTKTVERSYLETLTPQDIITKSTALIYSEFVAGSDANINSINKGLADGLGLTDILGKTSLLIITEVTTIADSDNAVSGLSSYTLSNDYVDNSYFIDEYNVSI